MRHRNIVSLVSFLTSSI